MATTTPRPLLRNSVEAARGTHVTDRPFTRTWANGYPSSRSSTAARCRLLEAARTAEAACPEARAIFCPEDESRDKGLERLERLGDAAGHGDARTAVMPADGTPELVSESSAE